MADASAFVCHSAFLGVRLNRPSTSAPLQPAAAGSTRRRRQPVRAQAASGSPEELEDSTRRPAVGRRRALAALGAAALAPSLGLVQPGPALAGAKGGLPGVERIELASGLEISRVLKGCWQLSGGHGRVSRGDALKDFEEFRKAGITTFDTADHYGPSEELIGDFLERLKPADRAGVQVLTKLCYFGPEMAFNAVPHAYQTVQRSVKRLRVPGPVDAVQFYWGDYDVGSYLDAARALADMREKGAIRHIGATNFDTPRLESMLDAGVPLVSHQVQVSVLDRRVHSGPMAAFCQERGVQLLAYGVLAGGFLSDKYLGAREPERAQLDTFSKMKYFSVIRKCGGWGRLQEVLRALRAVGDRHGQSVSNVACRYALQQPGVAGIILGARNASHVEEHRALFGFDLSPGDLEEIEAAAPPTLPGDFYDWERGRA